MMLNYQTISQQQWEAMGPDRPIIKLTEYDRVYHISSQTTPGKFYVVNAEKRSCNCQGYKYGRNCWHLGFVTAYDLWRTQTASLIALGILPTSTDY